MKAFQITMLRQRMFALFLVSVSSIGCGQFSSNAPVNETAARDACRTFLDAWKDGKSPADLKPRIYGSDYVWTAGKSLVSYEVLPNEIKNGRNMLISVQLTVQDDKGVKSKSNASYTVETYPVVTVIRDDS